MLPDLLLLKGFQKKRDFAGSDFVDEPEATVRMKTIQTKQMNIGVVAIGAVGGGAMMNVSNPNKRDG